MFYLKCGNNSGPILNRKLFFESPRTALLSALTLRSGHVSGYGIGKMVIPLNSFVFTLRQGVSSNSRICDYTI